MDATKTCGELHLRAQRALCDDDPHEIKLFGAGFVLGQCEKIYLGACSAAMFRPSKEYHEAIMHALDVACHIYEGLEWDILGEEFWVRRDEGKAHAIWRELKRMQKDGEETGGSWHHLRAILCGVRREDIDGTYDARAEYGKRCD